MSRSSGWGVLAARRPFHGSNTTLINCEHINHTGADDQLAVAQVPTPFSR
jgi:hypothetical protein